MIKEAIKFKDLIMAVPKRKTSVSKKNEKISSQIISSKYC